MIIYTKVLQLVHLQISPPPPSTKKHIKACAQSSEGSLCAEKSKKFCIKIVLICTILKRRAVSWLIQLLITVERF